jgi:hypothetical protein
MLRTHRYNYAVALPGTAQPNPGYRIPGSQFRAANSGLSCCISMLLRCPGQHSHIWAIMFRAANSRLSCCISMMLRCPEQPIPGYRVPGSQFRAILLHQYAVALPGTALPGTGKPVPGSHIRAIARWKTKKIPGSRMTSNFRL